MFSPPGGVSICNFVKCGLGLNSMSGVGWGARVVRGLMWLGDVSPSIQRFGRSRFDFAVAFQFRSGEAGGSRQRCLEVAFHPPIQ